MILFLLLRYFYLFLVAISTPGGTIPFDIPPEFSPIIQLVRLNQWVVSQLLLLTGYQVRFTDMGVGIKEGFGVWIEFPCLGIQVSYALIALVLAYPGKNKIPTIVLGLLLFQLINFLRIYLIILAGQQIPTIHIEVAHWIYNLIAYSIVLLLFYRYTQKQDRFDI